MQQFKLASAAFEKLQTKVKAPVTKAKHLLLAVLDTFNELGDILHLANALQHAQHCLVGAAMQRAVQSPNSAWYTWVSHASDRLMRSDSRQGRIRQTDRQAGRQTDRQPASHTQTNRQRQTTQINRQADRQAGRQTDGRTDRRTARPTDVNPQP